MAHRSDRKKSASGHLDIKKMIPWQHVCRKGFLMAKITVVITVVSQPHKASGHLEEPEAWHAQGNSQCIMSA